MTKIYSVTADRERLAGWLAWLQPQEERSRFFYAVWEREFKDGLLVNERIVASGASFDSRAEALDWGIKARMRFELEEREILAGDCQLAADKVQRGDERAMSLQVQANRRDPHAAGAY